MCISLPSLPCLSPSSPFPRPSPPVQLVRGTAFNPVCCSTYTFDRKLNVDELRETLERQCDIFPKYRQHLAIKDRLFHAPYYKDDPDFSVDRHFTIVELPGEAGPTELNRVVRPGQAVAARLGGALLPIAT